LDIPPPKMALFINSYSGLYFERWKGLLMVMMLRVNTCVNCDLSV